MGLILTPKHLAWLEVLFGAVQFAGIIGVIMSICYDWQKHKKIMADLDEQHKNLVEQMIKSYANPVPLDNNQRAIQDQRNREINP